MATLQYGIKDFEKDAKRLTRLSRHITPRRELSPGEVHKLSKIALLKGISFIYMVLVNFEELLDVNRSYHCQIDAAFDKVKSELACFQHSRLQFAAGEDSDEIDEICSIIEHINLQVKVLVVTLQESSLLKKVLNFLTTFMFDVINVLDCYGETLKACSYSPHNTETGWGKSELLALKTFPAVAKFLQKLPIFCSSPIPSTQNETSPAALANLLRGCMLNDNSDENIITRLSIKHFSTHSTGVSKKRTAGSGSLQKKKTLDRKRPVHKQNTRARSKSTRSRSEAQSSRIHFTILPCNISKRHGFGLPNIGNICWFSSVICALRFVLYLDRSHIPFNNNCSSLTFKTFSIFDTLNQNHLVNLRLRLYLQRVMHLIAVEFGWKLGQKQDAGKFLIRLMEKTDFSHVITHAGLITEVKVLLKTKCKSCLHLKEEEKTFKVFASTPELVKKDDTGTFLQKIVKQQFYRKCHCDSDDADVVDVTFLTAPDLILVYIVRASSHIKVFTPLNLNKPLEVSHEGKTCMYGLKAVICHRGDGCRSGHYLTYTIDDSSNPAAIYIHNDDFVYRLSSQDELLLFEKDMKKNGVFALFSKSR